MVARSLNKNKQRGHIICEPGGTLEYIDNLLRYDGDFQISFPYTRSHVFPQGIKITDLLVII